MKYIDINRNKLITFNEVSYNDDDHRVLTTNEYPVFDKLGNGSISQNQFLMSGGLNGIPDNVTTISSSTPPLVEDTRYIKYPIGAVKKITIFGANLERLAPRQSLIDSSLKCGLYRIGDWLELCHPNVASVFRLFDAKS